MSKLGFFLFIAILFTNCHRVLGSYSAPSAIYPRVDNSTSASVGPSSTNFTFATPSELHGDTFSDWVGVPDQMTVDQCSNTQFGDWIRCPNGDVSGILVRVATYLANLLLGIVVMFDPEEATEAVWAQLLTVYSLLISGVIAIGTQNLSRFHSRMTVFLVLSPLSTTLVFYAVRGFLGWPHRLPLLSRGRKILPRVLIIVSWLFSLALLIFTSIAKDAHFTAVSPCEDLADTGAAAAATYNLILIPYIGVLIVLLVIIGQYGPTASVSGSSLAIVVMGSAPFILLFVSFVYAVIKSWSSLAKLSSRKLFEERYPFVHFCGVFLVPMIYWVIVNEIQLAHSPDNIFSPSFGQVLKMIPRAFGWFTNLAIIRPIARPKKREIVQPLDLRVESQEMVSLGSRVKLTP
ncbi:hypothetical protein B0H19DRAFT_1338928 [Mycena capillaripes]|nr:hypothetical protein B0H19DRAFT_1338928 [Mycena capillaripes]